MGVCVCGVVGGDALRENVKYSLRGYGEVKFKSLLKCGVCFWLTKSNLFILKLYSYLCPLRLYKNIDIWYMRHAVYLYIL